MNLAPAAIKSVRTQVREFKRERIIEEALKLFYEVGFQSASMEMLAVRLGVTKPFIYTYFSNKHALLEELYARASDAVLAGLEEALKEDLPPETRLRNLTSNFVRNNIESQNLCAIYIQEERNLEAGMLENLVAREKTFDHAMTLLIQEGKDAGVFHVKDAALTSLALAGMARWTHRWYRPNGRLSVDEICNEFSEMALALVGAKGRAA